MADNRRYALTPQLDIGQILLDAQNRWLRPAEVCEILRNYRKFCLTPDPPYKPTGGSLFLFDRKALRYFRKDGHNWRKKKDGKTVREAHERLKAGSVDVLHCYYAHGEDNENFQRRSYWMLEGQYEHIVLVHYREVKEGNRAGILRSINSERTLQSVNQKGQIASAHSNQENSNALLTQTTYASSTSTADCNGPTHSSEYEEGESGDDVGASPAAEVDSSSGDQGSLLHPLNRVGELMTDSRSHPPLSHSNTFTNLLVENHTGYGPLKVNQAGSGECQFSDLHLSDHRPSLNRDGESQRNVHFQSDHSSRYGNGETISLLHSQGVFSDRQIQSSTINLGLSVWNELLRQSKNVETIGNGRNHRHDINSTTWTGVLQRSTTGLTNTAYEPNITGMQAMVSEDIRSRQAGNMMETLIRDELSGGQATFPDAHLQALARVDVQESSLQMGPQKLAPNPPPCSRMQEQMADWGHGPSDVLQENKCLSRDLQNPCAPADEQIQIQMQSNGSYQFWGAECVQSVKLERGNGLNSATLPVDCQASKELLGGNSFHVEGQEGLKKLDSFGRWMSREIGGDGEDSLVASDSGTYWNALDNQNGVEEVSSLSIQMQLDGDLMGPSLSQEQLFSIVDFSPDWAYSEADTKVLIMGTFLGSLKHLHRYKWCCMFGEIEVSAELLGDTVLRCQAPPHIPGRVPFYVTCSNRLACSEVREFEYRASPSGDANAGLTMDKDSVEKMLLEIRFAKALSLNLDIKQRYCCIDECEICSLRDKICNLVKDGNDEWVQTERYIKDSSRFLENTREQLLQKLLKEKLHDWLLYKVHEEGKGPNILDEQGQGILHIAAALGYDWALSPIIAAGVSVNFRDLHGWTALHWAAFYGREETVVALVTLGAAPGALTDPTPKFPAGRTPADLASGHGQKGIAGYLAESYLTSHLSRMTLKENIMDNASATLAGEKAVESVAEQSIVLLDGATNDQLSLKDSLAALRNSAQAAARIQAVFRVHSFRRKQLIEYGDDKCGISDEQALSFVSVQRTHKLGHYNEASHSAAIRIQRKFRGWKGRKEFLLIRNRIVKIQAHVRGHQVRKHYKKVVWSVGIVEKAILRWRRKRVGLRGFRAEALMGDSDAQGGGQHDDYDFLRAGRKQTVAGLEKALARVQSMVRYPEARDQYRRLLTNFQKTKVHIEAVADGEPQKTIDRKMDEQDVLLPMTD